MAKRRRYTPEFKARVALEAFKKGRTARQVGLTFGVHPNLVGPWKRKAIEGLPDLFERGGRQEGKDPADAELTKLLAKQRQLEVERDFLKDVLGL